MRVPRLGVLPVAVPGPLGSDGPGGALPSVHHVWLSRGVCARWRCQRGVACWPVAIVGAVGGAWPPRSPRCVCPGCPGAYDAPRTVEPTLPARATSAAGGRCCHLPVARLGTSAFGGGRPGAALSATRGLARPPAGTRPGFWPMASDAWLSLAAYRPDGSLSWGFRQALASAGLLRSSRLRLAPPPSRARLHRGLLEVPPFPGSMAPIRRAVLSTGLVGSADWAVSRDAGAFSCAFGLQRVSLWRWCACTVAPPPLRFRCP